MNVVGWKPEKREIFENNAWYFSIFDKITSIISSYAMLVNWDHNLGSAGRVTRRIPKDRFLLKKCRLG